MNRLPVLHRQVDRCDVCGNKKHKMDLVRTQVEYLKYAGVNMIPYSSSSDETYWGCTATDAGYISIGTRGDKFRKRVNDDNSYTIFGGTRTFTGNGTFSNSVALDLASISSFVVSAWVGPHYANETPNLTVSVGSEPRGVPLSAQSREWSISGSSRIWALIDEATAFGADTEIKITVTGTGDWWVDDLQIEPAVTSPGKFVPTSGAAVSATSESRGIAVRKVCPKCYEKVWQRSEEEGRPYIEVEPEIFSVNQEF